jgi:predicted RNA-binding Zn-ribbon protein involved in translation (DUF1610 family)
MNFPLPDPNTEKQWESVHRCPKCGYVVNLKDIGLRAVTTGIITCPTCSWSGVVTIEIVEEEKLVE